MHMWLWETLWRSELIPLEYEEATEKERKEMDDGKECFIWPEYEELFWPHSD